MAHQAIYRKWRPMVFEDIVGQGHITQTLKNQILNDKIGSCLPILRNARNG